MRAPANRILDAADAAAFAADVRRLGGTVVFTNGVFDLLHPGHIRYLQDARRLGDALIVAVNSDRSVRGNKGPERPITPERERAEVLLALGCVDAVPVRATAMEERLAAGFSDAAVRAAAEGLGASLDPPSDAHGSGDFRRHLAEVSAARAVQQAASRRKAA